MAGLIARAHFRVRTVAIVYRQTTEARAAQWTRILGGLPDTEAHSVRVTQTCEGGVSISGPLARCIGRSADNYKEG
jgi:hypothetical protein